MLRPRIISAVKAHQFCVTGKSIPSYNQAMQLALFGMHVLETLFFVGLVGSSIVVIISFIEDGKELFSKGE
jgi:hypothetical protein